jgi:hypothetical protein
MLWIGPFPFVKKTMCFKTYHQGQRESPFDFSIVLSLFKVLCIYVLLNPRTPNLIITCHNIKETKMKQRFDVQLNIH